MAHDPQPTKESKKQTQTEGDVANAQIVASWSEGGYACLSLAVNEGPPWGRREYTGRVAVNDDWQALTNPQKRAALIAAAKAHRDQTLAPAQVDLGVAGGTVAI